MNYKTITETDSVYTNDILKNKSGGLYKVIGFKVSDTGFLDQSQMILKPYPIDFAESSKIETDKDTLIKEGWLRAK